MLQYLLMPLRWLWRLLTISQTLVFGVLGLVILVGLLMAPFSDDTPGIPDRGALVLDLQGVLVEEKQPLILWNYSSRVSGPWRPICVPSLRL